MNKQLPSSVETERVILGAILIDNDAFDSVESLLAPEDFYDTFNRGVFAVMAKLRSELLSLDAVMISSRFKEEIESYTGESLHRISQLSLGIPRIEIKGLTEYAKLVKQKAVSRLLIKTCGEIIARTLEDVDPIEEILDESEGSILGVASVLQTKSGEGVAGFYSLAEVVPAMEKQFEDYREGITSGIRTGMPELDLMLDGGGLQNQGVYLVGGSEKSGKTSVALDWAYNIAFVQKKGVLVSTGEMNKVTLSKRIYSGHSGIPFYMFRPGLHGEKYNQAVGGLGEFAKIPIQVADKLRTMGQIRRHFIRAVAESRKPGRVQVALGVIDYLQLIELDGPDNNKQRVEVVSRISRELKLLAAELDIPLVIMSSLNRLGMTEGQRPDTFNLRESQQLAFDAEAVMFLHNPAYVPGKPYTPQEVTPIDLILARQRNGPTGDVQMHFIGPMMQFLTASQYRDYVGTGLRETDTIKKDEDFNSLWE